MNGEILRREEEIDIMCKENQKLRGEYCASWAEYPEYIAVPRWQDRHIAQRLQKQTKINKTINPITPLQQR